MTLVPKSAVTKGDGVSQHSIDTAKKLATQNLKLSMHTLFSPTPTFAAWISSRPGQRASRNRERWPSEAGLRRFQVKILDVTSDYGIDEADYQIRSFRRREISKPIKSPMRNRPRVTPRKNRNCAMLGVKSDRRAFRPIVGLEPQDLFRR